MGSTCFKKLRKVKSSEEEFSPPLRLPTVKKQSLVRTTDDMPTNKLFLPLQMNKNISDESKSIEVDSNSQHFFPPKTPRTIIHTSSLQKRRNSEVFLSTKLD